MNTAHRTASQSKRRWQKDPGAFGRVINRLAPFNAAELLRLELPIRVSFEALKTGTGTGTEQDFHDCAAAINVAIVRAIDIDSLCEQTATDAADALMRMWERWQRTGKWGFDGPGLGEVEAGIDLHEQLCRLSTPLQMMRAMERVIAMHRKKFESTS